MRFAIHLLFCSLLFSCASKRDVKDPDQMYPPYKLLNIYSKRIEKKTNLALRSYGINIGIPKSYEYKNGIANFRTSYSLGKNKNDEISLESARNLIVFLAENLLVEINTNLEVRPDLDVYPFVNDMLDISLYFEDEDRAHLGQGVAIVYFSQGKIKYKGYNIEGYRKPGRAYGKHYIIHEENYADALDIVKKQGTLRYL